MKTIDRFDGEFAFLSNFWDSKVHYDGIEYKTVEHAYQAAKSLDKDERLKVRNAKTAAESKKLGQKVTLRKDWDNVKLDIMLSLLREKFAIPELRQLLLDTGDAELIEGNWWGDTFYGVCKGKGLNHLGRMLMLVRNEVRGK